MIRIAFTPRASLRARAQSVACAMQSHAFMNSIRKILVPVDFSEPSQAALSYAAEFAKPFGASIDLLHVWEIPSFMPARALAIEGSADLALVDLVKQNAERELDQFVAAARARGIAVHEARSEPGSPAHAIVERAREDGYDLIILGTHGRTGLSHVLIGSVAERVVRHARCPVLSIRSNAASG
jgi:universal stress protein A